MSGDTFGADELIDVGGVGDGEGVCDWRDEAAQSIQSPTRSGIPRRLAAKYL